MFDILSIFLLISIRSLRKQRQVAPDIHIGLAVCIPFYISIRSLIKSKGVTKEKEVHGAWGRKSSILTNPSSYRRVSPEIHIGRTVYIPFYIHQKHKGIQGSSQSKEIEGSSPRDPYRTYCLYSFLYPFLLFPQASNGYIRRITDDVSLRHDEKPKKTNVKPSPLANPLILLSF